MKKENIDLKELIGKYINRYLYSDVLPVGQIVAVDGKSTLIVKIIRPGENKTKMNFVAGGFSAICTNQYAQEYDFYETGEIIKIRYSKSNFNKSLKIDDQPINHYDFNF